MKAFDVVVGGKCVVAWPQVQRPLRLGGLCILDMELFGKALHLIWLWTQRTCPENAALPIAENDRELQAFFNNSVIVQACSFGRTNGCATNP